MNMRNIEKETNDLDYQSGSFHWQNRNIDKIESCYTFMLCTLRLPFYNTICFQYRKKQA